MKRLLSVTTLAMGVFLMASCVKPRDVSHLRQENAKMDREEIYKNAVIPQGPLVLQDFLALGLMQNFDIKMKQQEYLVQKELATGEQLKMLPSLKAQADWQHYSHYQASGSYNVETGATNYADSISEPRNTQVQSVTMAWNILDFGITYLRSRQEMAREAIALQEYKRLKQNTILEITDAYWQSVVALKSKDGAMYLIQQINDRQKSLDKQMGSKSVSEVEGLENHRSLIEMEIKLQGYERQLNMTKASLARLAGLPPTAEFDIQDIELAPLDINMPAIPDLESLAFNNRPELYVNDQQVEIALDEVRVSLLSLLPSANLTAAYNHENNDFLMHKTWYTAGINAAWDLFSLPQKFYQKQSAEERVKAAQNARFAMSLALLSQVHLAYLQYQDAIRQYELAVQLESVKTRLLEAGKKGKQQGESDNADILRLETEAFLSQIYKCKAYSDLRVALERLANTLGRPLHFSPEIVVEAVSQDAFVKEKAEAAYIGDADVNVRSEKRNSNVAFNQQNNVSQIDDNQEIAVVDSMESDAVVQVVGDSARQEDASSVSASRDSTDQQEISSVVNQDDDDSDNEHRTN